MPEPHPLAAAVPSAPLPLTATAVARERRINRHLLPSSPFLP
ncbi:TPA: hypothetical protein ACOR61_003476 [Salmonella enterica]